MYPIICEFGPFTVYSYGLMIVLAFSISVFLLTRQTSREGLNPDFIFNLCFITLGCGIIGARLLYVVLNIDYFFLNPVEIVMLNRGGLAWFGGLFLASAGFIIYLKFKRQGIYKIADMVIPYVALAQAIGRVGCLLNGCCFGERTFGFGLYFPVHQAVLIPTQIYSSLLLLGIYVILRIKYSRVHLSGEILYFYFLLYSLKRFFIEFPRADNAVVIFNLSIFQIFSVGLFIFSLIMLFKIHIPQMRTDKKIQDQHR
ncbi:prolipoprotein diacylglyceryl transferase [Candidatus Omnitrophota bacterium]